MSCHKNKAPTTRPVVRVSAILAATLYALLASSTVFAVDSGDIVLVSLKGEVLVTMSGVKRSVSAGSVLEPPATLRTGRDGAVELRQGATTLSVGPETLLEFPALEKRGAPIDRIVQPRGNVFYNIGKREGRKLRIETPYLVGVVKGTQFNVAAQEDTTTISLFEGLLEVRAADESGVVDLRAGEIASRQRDDKGVSVLKMEGANTPAIQSRPPAGSGSNGSAPSPTPPRSTPQHPDRDSVLVDVSAAAVSIDFRVADLGDSREAVPTAFETAVAASVIEPVDVPHAVAVDTLMAPVDAGDIARVTAASVDASIPIAVDLHPAPDASGIDAGGAASAGTGVPTTDTGVNANVDLGSDLTVINGSSSHLVEVTVGSENAADAVAGHNHGHDVSSENHGPKVDVSVDLGVDLGLGDDSANSPDTDNSGKDKPGKGRPADADLLDGLMRHRGKR
jgi:hypothetical protein